MAEKSTTDRRSFLKLASLGSAGAIAATATVQTVNGEVLSDDSPKGYSETEHVKKVYKLARF
ncbi:MAG: twin-arginine translocation signal domain-containing protein [Hyphomicrobiales bacterium]|nr:twin-arginine translocation signal domain-containing protein [Hyphomicrobiales bacterium]